MNQQIKKYLFASGLFLLGAWGAGSVKAQESFEKVYLVPLPEEDVFDALKAIHNGVKEPIVARTSIVPSLTNTVVHYDHWEDGYENNIFSPTQSTTEVWGDNNTTNGLAPNYTNDLFGAGNTISLVNEVALPRDPAIVLFDGGDQIGLSLPASVSRILNAKDPGEALAGGVNIYSFDKYGVEFVAPVGTNSDAGTMYQYAGMFVMASKDSTIIKIDRDADGIFEETELLGKGDNVTVDDVNSGARISANKPLQVHMITGAESSSFQMRWFELVSESHWDDEYYSPVGSSGGRDARAWLYNANTHSITAHYETLSSTGSMVIASDTHETFDYPSDTGTRFYTTDESTFQAVGVMDYGSHAYDWGHILFPADLLTELTLVGYGPGSGNPSVNGSPIWVTPVSNTTLYIDYDGDPTTGPNTDSKGNKYDVSTNVVRLGSHRIYDNNDNDQTAMRVYSLDGTTMAGVWGLDPDNSSAGNPYLDMGYSLFPVPILVPIKTASILTDNDGDGLFSPGDTVIYTVRVTRVGFGDETDEVIVVDTGPVNASYVTNTLTVGGTNIVDDAVPPASTPFPLDEGGYNVGVIDFGETVFLTYQALIDDPFPAGENSVENTVVAGGRATTHYISINLGGLISGQVRSDLDGDGDLRDPDPGIPDVTVELYTDPNQDGDPSDGSSVDTNVTGQLGTYFFENVSTGSYVIVETDPQGHYSTADTAGTNDNRIAVTLVPGLDLVDNDFLDSQSGLSMTKSASPPGIWFPGLQAQYTITLVNTSTVPHTGVYVNDPEPTGVTYVADSTIILFDTLATNNVRDEFSSVSFGNNDGAENWETDWAESDGGGSGPTLGAVIVTNGQLRMTDGVGGSVSMTREAELVGFSDAELSFTYDTSIGVDLADTVDLDVSSDGAAWTTLDTFTGAVAGVTNYDITAYISADTHIRFSIASYNGTEEYFYIDDVEIRSTEVDTVVTNGGALPAVAEDFTLIGGGSLQVIFDVTVGSSNDVIFNEACAYSSVWTNEVCATNFHTVDTNAFPDRVGGQVRNDLDGDGDLDDSDTGIPGVTITLWTDPNSDGDPADGSAIGTNLTQVNGFYLFGNLDPGHYVVVETDLPAFASTGDRIGANDNWVPVHLPGGIDSTTNDFLDWTISGLDITKISDQEGEEVDAGDELLYTIVVSNSRIVAQGNVAVNDPLPVGLTYQTTSTQVRIMTPQDTNDFGDDFEVTAYTNNTGTLSWNREWQEAGDDGNATRGDVEIVTDLGGGRLKIQDDANEISRTMDLTAYDSATLSFDYRRSSLEAGEYVMVEIATNEGEGWIELDRFQGPATDVAYVSTNYDVSTYMGSNTALRFRSPAGGMANADQFYLDNVDVELLRGGTVITTGGAPPTLISGYVVEPAQAIEITFRATVGLDDSIVNEACVTTAADPSGLCDSTSNSISSIVMTQGMVNVQGGLMGCQLGWTAATDGEGDVIRDYDLLCFDSPAYAPGFHASISNEWALASTVMDSHETDTGAVGRPSPTAIGDSMRFYRVAREDRWLMANETRYASPEIYMAKCFHLLEGENWKSLMMAPDINTLDGVFGTNQLPSGATMGAATRIEWYGSGAQDGATNVVWLADPGIWMFSTGGVAGSYSLPLNEGFNIVLPPGSGTNDILIVGRVPTNTSAQLGHQHTLAPSGSYNVVSYNLPYRATLAESGLREAGFSGAPAGELVNPNNSDELRIFSEGSGSMGSPKYRILMNGDDQFVYWSGGSGSAEYHRLGVDDALVIYTRVSTTAITWNISLPYPIPTSTMSP